MGEGALRPTSDGLDVAGKAVLGTVDDRFRNAQPGAGHVRGGGGMSGQFRADGIKENHADIIP